MAAYAVTTSNSLLAISTNGTEAWPTVVLMDANHFVYVSSNNTKNTRYAVVAINTSTWAVTTTQALTAVQGNQMVGLTSAKIDDTHLIFIGGRTADGKAQVLSYNTSTFVISTAYGDFTFDTTDQANHNSACMIDANHCINFWSSSGSDGYVQVMTINTSTWAVTTSAALLEFDTQYGIYHDCLLLDSTHCVNYWLGSSGLNLQAFTFSTSTWAVTTSNALLLFDTSGLCYDGEIILVDTNHILTVWRGKYVSAPMVNAQVFTVNTSTFAITTSNAVLTIDTAGTNAIPQISISKVDTNHFLVSYADAALDGMAITLEVNTSTWAVTTSVASLEFDTRNAVYGSLIKIDTNHFANTWVGQDGTAISYSQVLQVELPALGPANLKSLNTSLVANIKTINTSTIANTKSWNTIT